MQNWACTYGGQPSPRHVQGLQTAAADRVKNIVISDWLTFLTTRQQTKKTKKKTMQLKTEVIASMKLLMHCSVVLKH